MVTFLAILACQRERETASASAAGSFSLCYQVSAATRSSIPLQEGEDQINSLYVLFFEESGDGSGKFLGYYQVPTRDSDGNLLDPPLSSRNEVQVSFQEITVIADQDIPANNFNPDGDYTLLVVANIDAYIGELDATTWLAAMKGKTERQILNGAFLQVTGATDVSDETRTIQPTNLPMNARATRVAHQSTVSVELRRSVFRVSIINEAAEYTLVSAAIWNAYPETPAWEGVMNLFERPCIKRFYGIKATNNEIPSGLYAFENTVTDNEKNDARTTCLVLGFEKNGQLYYYRADLNVIPDLGQHLERNGAYRLRVKKITGEGEASEIDAYTANKLLLEISVNEWNLDEQGTLLSDGQNTLAVPTNDIVFSPAAETRAYYIYTQGTAELVLAKIVLPVGIHASLDGHTLTISVDASNEAREGYVELQFAGLKALVNIHQRSGSEHFLELSRYSVPVFPGNGVFQLEGNIRVSSSGPWSARIHGEGFTFQYRASGIISDLLSHRLPDETFTITTTGTNPNDATRHAFVSVQLDEEPEIHQVLIISQDRPVNFNITPPISSSEKIAFNAAGTRTLGRERYKVDVDATLEWKAVSSNNHFTVHYHDENGNEQINATSCTGPGYFSISAATNTTAATLSATVDIYLTTIPAAKQTIALSQDVFTLELGAAQGSLPAAGGQKEVAVTLTPALPAAKWVATVTTSTAGANHQAYINAPGTLEASGLLATPVTVTFPRLSFENARLTPSVTLTVSIEGVAIARSLVFAQTSWPWRPLIVQSTGSSGFGSMSNSPANPRYFDAFNDAIRTAAYFGPSGTVPTPGAFSFITGSTVSASTTLFNANVLPINANDRAAIKAWMETRGDNFLMACCDDYDSAVNRWDLIRLFSTDFNTASRSGNVRSVAPRPEDEIRARLWDYIFVNGPFGSSSLSTTFGTDNIDRALVSYPSTTVPLLVEPDGSAQVALDPVLRILYIGDVDIFGTVSSRNLFPENSDKWRIMNNVIAFIVNASQYGEAFLYQFRGE
jgi:hypothetical protein